MVSKGQKKDTRARLQAHYEDTLKADLQKVLGLDNVMQVPRIDKIVVNVGVKEAVSDSRVINAVAQIIDSITGQKSARTHVRKSIAGFKIREGMPIGVMVTLRNRRMYEFLDKLINLSLPRVRDFQGVTTKLDGRGNYNLGIKEWNIFPEADNVNDRMHGLNITICTNAGRDDRGYELLKVLGMPFKKK